MTVRIDTTRPLQVQLDDLIGELVHHPLYARVRDEASLRLFMRTHVFCVFDFQSLLKGLQRRLTCVAVPWLPSDDPEARRLINEIVLDEESDAMPDGSYLSHFELYLQAMRQCGADVRPILRLISAIRAGVLADRALADPALPPGVADFVSRTLRIAERDEVHRVAAAFTYGREDVIPAMFEQLVARPGWRAAREVGVVRAVPAAAHRTRRRAPRAVVAGAGGAAVRRRRAAVAGSGADGTSLPAVTAGPVGPHPRGAGEGGSLTLPTRLLSRPVCGASAAHRPLHVRAPKYGKSASHAWVT